MRNIKFANLIKCNRLVFNVYSFSGSLLMRFISMFIRTDPQLILFNSFSGKAYDDSPKEIYEKMLADERFKGYKLIWAFINIENFNTIPHAIKIGSFRYFLTALKAAGWISNGSIELGLRFKRKRQFYLNTWHGTPIKKMELDLEKKHRPIGIPLTSKKGFTADFMCVQGAYDAKIMRRAFNLDCSKILMSGYPRNDILAHYDENVKQLLIDKLNLPQGKKIILYCPTFRDYDKEGAQNFLLNTPIDFNKWENAIGNEYLVLFRAHYHIINSFDIKFNNFVHDFSEYNCLNDLMIISDLLISDYSSVYFDYSIMGKPMLCFAYDYAKYMENRGLYIDITKELPCEVMYDEDSLLEQINELSFAEAQKDVCSFRDKYVEMFGSATSICVDKVWENIKCQ